MTFNAFTAPRRPAFSESERRAMRQSAAGRSAGQINHRNNHGQVFTTASPLPKASKKG